MTVLPSDSVSDWRALHKARGEHLSTVGWSALSDAFNALKYDSESETVLAALQDHIPPGAGDMRVLDIGAGIGYWIGPIRSWLEDRGFRVSMTALDVSEDALAAVRRKHPQTDLIHQDLRAVSPKLAAGRFQLVYAFYCFHHLLSPDAFANALIFAARSLSPGGRLLIMDPVLTRPHSPFDRPDAARNGQPRRLALIDGILQREGLTRVAMVPAVSFLLNSPIEAAGRASFALRHWLWRVLTLAYRSDRRTRLLRPLLPPLDRWCKRHGQGFSSSLCVYSK